MNSKQAKSFIALLLPQGTKLCARTVSKRFIEVRIPSEPALNGFCPLIYSAEIPVALRQAALKVVYPNSPKIHAQTAAGNIDGHSVCMSPDEWDATALAYLQTV